MNQLPATIDEMVMVFMDCVEEEIVKEDDLISWMRDAGAGGNELQWKFALVKYKTGINIKPVEQKELFIHTGEGETEPAFIILDVLTKQLSAVVKPHSDKYLENAMGFEPHHERYIEWEIPNVTGPVANDMMMDIASVSVCILRGVKIVEQYTMGIEECDGSQNSIYMPKKDSVFEYHYSESGILGRDAVGEYIVKRTYQPTDLLYIADPGNWFSRVQNIAFWGFTVRMDSHEIEAKIEEVVRDNKYKALAIPHCVGIDRLRSYVREKVNLTYKTKGLDTSGGG
jgi:hypothetical protein